MDYPLPVLKPRGFVSRGAVVALAFLVTSFSLLADTRYSLRTNSTGACYCHCPVAKAHSGCAKMCETPKFASRWWATSCARPRRKAPANNPGAGPRLPHPDRAERAQLQN
jgi:hypothetical protein